MISEASASFRLWEYCLGSVPLSPTD